LARLASLLALFLWAAAWSVGQEPTDPLQRLQTLLEAPKPADASWRKSIWAQLMQLEHGPVEQVLPGWQVLAESGADRDQANLLVYQRRHGLPLAAAITLEGAESSLERCLALWGAGQLSEAQIALKHATELYPADIRFRDNLLWLELNPPARISLDGDARHLALAVLAAATPHN
jgi:hypothetical protein